MEEEFIYYILKEPVNNGALGYSKLPLVIKVKKDLLGWNLSLIDKNEAEGPFFTKFDLRKQSTIFSSIRLQKHKESVYKNKNIKEIKDYILINRGENYEKTFLESLHHTMVGKISKKKVSGVHFYNPDFIRIVKIKKFNDLGVYNAIIDKLNLNTGKWFRKDGLTSFFPDNWSINQLFHECAFAYLNRKNESGNVYLSKTFSGIEVKFVINNDGKIVTFYPLI